MQRRCVCVGLQRGLWRTSIVLEDCIKVFVIPQCGRAFHEYVNYCILPQESGLQTSLFAVNSLHTSEQISSNSLSRNMGGWISNIFHLQTQFHLVKMNFLDQLASTSCHFFVDQKLFSHICLRFSGPQAVCALWLRCIMVVNRKISHLHPVVVEWTR